jgi:hypothetical protein
VLLPDTYPCLSESAASITPPNGRPRKTPVTSRARHEERGKVSSLPSHRHGPWPPLDLELAVGTVTGQVGRSLMFADGAVVLSLGMRDYAWDAGDGLQRYLSARITTSRGWWPGSQSTVTPERLR